VIVKQFVYKLVHYYTPINIQQKQILFRLNNAFFQREMACCHCIEMVQTCNYGYVLFINETKPSIPSLTQRRVRCVASTVAKKSP